MALVFTKRGKKTHVTSSFFKDIAVLRNSEIDTGYRQMYHDKRGDEVHKLQMAYAVQKLIYFKKGCHEVSDYVMKCQPNKLENLVADYIGSTYEEYTGPLNIEECLKPDTEEKPVYRTSGDK
jgi:hypothetical protein